MCLRDRLLQRKNVNMNNNKYRKEIEIFLKWKRIAKQLIHWFLIDFRCSKETINTEV